MNRAPRPSSPLSSHELARAFKALPPAAASGLVVAVALCALLAVVKPALGSAVTAVSPAIAEAEVAPAAARPKFRCQACGVVEAMQRTEADGDKPASYEFTVRLRDGSSRVSSDANPGRWNIGDHIMLIGGAAPRS